MPEESAPIHYGKSVRRTTGSRPQVGELGEKKYLERSRKYEVRVDNVASSRLTEIQKYFEDQGCQIQDQDGVRIPRQSLGLEGSVFISFKDADSVRKAEQLNNTSLFDQIIQVKEKIRGRRGGKGGNKGSKAGSENKRLTREPSRERCQDFRRKQCRFGEKCKYSHG